MGSGDHQIVFNRCCAASGPGGRASGAPFLPRVDRAGQLDATTFSRDVDILGLKENRTVKRMLDIVLQMRGIDVWLDRNLIRNAEHAHEIANFAFGRFFLEMPVDLAGDRQPALLDLDLDGNARRRRVLGKTVDGCGCDVGIIALDLER